MSRQMSAAFLAPAAYGYHGQGLSVSRNRKATAIYQRPYNVSRTSTASFLGLQLPRSRLNQISQHDAVHSQSCTKMVVDPWSVSSEALDVLAGQFFAASLFPYLGFLYFLGREEVRCPKLANFGFRFLLVFVFATIPAGIYAKVHFHDILANIDWLHGGAESLLTITNLIIVLGFRIAMSTPKDADTSITPDKWRDSSSLQLKSIIFPLLLMSGLVSSFSGLSMIHSEPGNALSFPTWIIHVSSLVEWLVAMGLVWKYAAFSGNSRWKGLTWGMLPLHTSGICACTYHLFYNAPSLNALVALQAALTCFGNATMAAATYRIYQTGRETSIEKSSSSVSGKGVALVGFEDLATGLEQDTNAEFFFKVFAISCVGSAFVKWGSLLFDAPFQHSLVLALTIIFVPTGLNMMKWAVRSQSDSSDFGGYL